MFTEKLFSDAVQKIRTMDMMKYLIMMITGKQ